jgi:hypothetical protein
MGPAEARRRALLHRLEGAEEQFVVVRVAAGEVGAVEETDADDLLRVGLAVSAAGGLNMARKVASCCEFFGVRTAWNLQSRLLDPALGGGALLDVGVYPISLAYMVLGGPPKKIAMIAGAVLFVAFAVREIPVVRFLATDPRDLPAEGRIQIWATSIQAFRQFPVAGSGLGTFAWIFPMYRSELLIGMATHAENDYLQLASEVGLVGVGLLLILLVFLSYKTVSGIRVLSRREPERYIGIGSLVGILALMLHSIVERNIQVPSNAFLYTILWGVVLNISLTKRGAISPGAYQNISVPVGRTSEYQNIREEDDKFG